MGGGRLIRIGLQEQQSRQARAVEDALSGSRHHRRAHFYYTVQEGENSFVICPAPLMLTLLPMLSADRTKALRSVHIDLFNLMDHRRNPSVELIHFASQRALSSAIRARKMLPRVAAKQAGPIRGLLIRV